MPQSHHQGKLRIIGGRWRSRTIFFDPTKPIRPTASRIRETLFNWLSPNIGGSSCLDLFAGSGALGFEALSRGASKCLFIDSDQQIINTLKKVAQTLKTGDADFSRLSIPSGVLKNDYKFDIVFIDPPFQTGLVAESVAWLVTSNCLRANALVYIETERSLALSKLLPTTWQQLKVKSTKQVSYYLYLIP